MGEAVAPPGPPSAGKARHDEIVAVFQKHREKFRCCYDAARQQTPALKGAYQIEIVLKTDGSIKQITPKKEASEIHDQAMDDCVFTVARALAFSPNADGKETTIPYPFTFTPGGGGK
ncbi:MAG: AgmX/PglI C-terminal domain-containing protein [Polyangiaceae bacterium]|nr:AgmX/PglI C-terminal domain-containing protein [Polyangiaceae bacterium]